MADREEVIREREREALRRPYLIRLPDDAPCPPVTGDSQSDKSPPSISRVCTREHSVGLLPGLMQVIVKSPCRTVEEYIGQEAHMRVRPPERCPRCGKLHTLDLLGYYQRGCTDSEGKVREMNVARFECSNCTVSVSCLPDFAQPYRLINNATTQKFFNGDRESRDVLRILDNLRRYWRRFVDMAKRLQQIVGCSLGRAPPKEPAAGLWQRILAKYRTLANATRNLVSEFKTTCFGKYGCHSPAVQGA